MYVSVCIVVTGVEDDTLCGVGVVVEGTSIEDGGMGVLTEAS